MFNSTIARRIIINYIINCNHNAELWLSIMRHTSTPVVMFIFSAAQTISREAQAEIQACHRHRTSDKKRTIIITEFNKAEQTNNWCLTQQQPFHSTTTHAHAGRRTTLISHISIPARHYWSSSDSDNSCSSDDVTHPSTSVINFIAQRSTTIITSMRRATTISTSMQQPKANITSMQQPTAVITSMQQSTADITSIQQPTADIAIMSHSYNNWLLSSSFDIFSSHYRLRQRHLRLLFCRLWRLKASQQVSEHFQHFNNIFGPLSENG